MVKVKKPKKRRQLSIMSLHKKLDKEFSHYVRWSRCDEKGYVACVTCNTKGHWKKMQAGHFVSRNEWYVKWNENNVFPQCVRCNKYLEGNKNKYVIFLDKTIGIEARLQLENTTVQITRQWLEEQIKQYKQLNLKFKHLL